MNKLRRSSNSAGQRIKPDEQLQKWANTLQKASTKEVGIIKGTWKFTFKPVDNFAFLGLHNIIDLDIERTGSWSLLGGSEEATLTWLKNNIQQEWGQMIDYAVDKSSSDYSDTYPVKVAAKINTLSYDLHFKHDESQTLPDGQIKIVVDVSKPGHLARSSGYDPEGSDLARQISALSASDHYPAGSSNMAPPASGPVDLERSISNADAPSIGGTDMSGSALSNRESGAPVIPETKFLGADFGLHFGDNNSSGDEAAATRTPPRQEPADSDAASLASSADLQPGQATGDNASETNYPPYFEPDEEIAFGATYVPGSGSQLGLSFSGELPPLSRHQTADGASVYSQSQGAPSFVSGQDDDGLDQASSAELGAPGPSAQQPSSLAPDKSDDGRSEISSLTPSERVKRFSIASDGMRVSVDE